MAEFSPDKIQSIVKKYIRQTLENDERCRAGIQLPEDKSLLEGSAMEGEEIHSLLCSVERWMKNKDHSLMDSVTKKCLEAEGAAVDPESVPYKLLSRELLKAFNSVLKVRIKRSEGDYAAPDHELIPMLKQEEHVTIEVPQEAVRDVSTVLFSDVQKRYVAESEKGNSWGVKTKVEYLKSYALFVEVMGDMDVAKIDRKMMNKFKDTLMKLPPNMNKNPLYRDLSVDEILELKPEETIAPRTINKHLVRIGSLFGYAVKCGDMLSNPATDLQVKIKSRPDEERPELSSEDLIKVFDLKLLSKFQGKYPARFWSPLIALYSGCRLEEICQMHLDDIREEDGVWVFDINAKGEKKLKNMASSRLVPIHAQLIDLGLLKYVEEVSASGELRLFPELSNRQHGNYGHSVSRWFSTYRAKCGVAAGKTFHSLRHYAEFLTMPSN
jgi:integrase